VKRLAGLAFDRFCGEVSDMTEFGERANIVVGAMRRDGFNMIEKREHWITPVKLKTRSVPAQSFALVSHRVAH
jgi:hypothetical protein